MVHRVTYEKVLSEVGDSGPYQLFLCLLLGLVNMWVNIATIAVNFLSPNLPHWCRVPEAQECSEDWKEAFIPKRSDGRYESCKMYQTSLNYTCDDVIEWTNVTSRPIVSCAYSWDFDTSERHDTVMSEWDLVCDREWILDLISPIFITGLLAGSFLGGAVSDRFGRRSTLLLFCLVHVVAGIATAFSVNEWMYIALRTIVGISIRAFGPCGVVLMMEVLAPRHRVPAVITYQIFFAFGTMTLSFTAYFLRTWRLLQLMLVAPYALFLLYRWIIPESPRWLLSKGRTEEVRQTLQKIAQVNKKPFPLQLANEYIEQNAPKHKNDESHVKKVSMKDLIKRPPIRRNILLCSMSKTIAQFIFFAYSFNMGTLFGDIYTNVMVTAAIDMPVFFILGVVMQKIGRRPPIIINFFISATCSAICIYAQLAGHEMTVTILSIIARTTASCCFCNTDVFLGELFPTSIRQMAMGVVNSTAAAVSIASSYVGGPLAEVWRPLPFVIFASLGYLASLLSFLFPETLGQPLPDTTADVAEINKHKRRLKRPKTGTTDHAKHSPESGTRPVVFIIGGDSIDESEGPENSEVPHLDDGQEPPSPPEKAISAPQRPGEETNTSTDREVQGHSNAAFSLEGDATTYL